MRKIKKLMLVTIAFIVSLFLIMFANTYMHEQAHKQYAINNGCKQYTISYSLAEAQFNCTNRTSISKDRDDMEYMIQSMNEVITYNNETLIMLIFLIGYIICFLMVSTGAKE